jgi:hypothetical protein
MELFVVVKDTYQKQQTRIEPEFCRSRSQARFVFTTACLAIPFCRTESYVLLCGRLSEIQRFYSLDNSNYVY